ncbi:hypothetical protein N9I13_00605 [bacterium]|nr:hypothetical protein [bacterium]
MKKLFVLFVLGILTSCGSSYQLSTLNHTPDYIGDVRVDVIDNEMELSRLLRNDDTFRWDFAQYAMNQDMRWQYDFYWDNRMFRRSAFGSPFNFYWNSHQYWWNWATNSHFNMGFNHWDPFGFNNYGWGSRYYGYGYGWNNGYYGNGWGYRNRMNDYAWNNRNRTNTAYVVGRRSSNNVVVSNRTNTIKDRVIVNRNKPRVVNSKDVVIDREIIKLKRNNNNIRIYNNPNNVPTVIIRNNNNNSKPIRNYNRIENSSNNNNIRNNNNNNSRPVRTYTPPSRSSSPPVVNRSSGGSKPVIKR